MAKKVKFNIPDPLVAFNNLDITKKYVFGEVGNRLNEIKQQKPVFAFDYMSLKNSDFCFNTKLMSSKEYHRLFANLKSLSQKSYNDLTTDYSFHFHEVEFDDVSFSQSDFIKCLAADVTKINQDQCPTVYQFKIFEEARIFGFIYKTVFYLVFFDRNHNGYKRK